MLQRAFIHLSLVILFAFTQMGVVTHEISHISETSHQSQRDKNTTDNGCERCISLSHADASDVVQSTGFKITPSDNAFKVNARISFTSASRFFFSARAPPKNSQA